MLKDLRKKANMTQKELAQSISVVQPLISFWENGSRKPKLEIVPKLAEVLGVSTDEILSCFNGK